MWPITAVALGLAVRASPTASVIQARDTMADILTTVGRAVASEAHGTVEVLHAMRCWPGPCAVSLDTQKRWAQALAAGAHGAVAAPGSRRGAPYRVIFEAPTVTHDTATVRVSYEFAGRSQRTQGERDVMFVLVQQGGTWKVVAKHTTRLS